MNGFLKLIVDCQKVIMSNSRLKRKEFTYRYEDQKFIVENPSDNTHIAIIITGITSFLIFPAIYQIFARKIDFFACATLLAVGLFGLRQFLWLIKGIEKIEIDKENLTIKREGSFLKKSNTYELRKIKSLKAKTVNDKDKTELKKHIQEMTEKVFENHNLLFGNNNGDIFFKYESKTIGMLNGLNHEQKQLVISEIEKRLV